MDRKMKILALFAFILFSVLPGAIFPWIIADWAHSLLDIRDSTMCNTSGSNLDWIGLSFIALMLGTMLNACARALSGAIGTPKYNEFLKTHLWALLEGAVVLMVLSASIAGLAEFGTETNDTARAYTTIIRNTSIFDFAAVLTGSTFISLFTNVSPHVRLPGTKLGLFITVQYAPIFKPVYDTLGLLMQLITVSILTWFGHEFLLCMVKTQMLVLLLPAGIFLRSMGIKNGGNALIGIAIALYFIYPYMIMMVGQTVTNHIESQINRFMETTDVGANPAKTVKVDHSWDTCEDEPICCLALIDERPDTDDEPFILNGDEKISVEKINKGPIVVSLTGEYFTTGTMCMYNTMMGRVYNGIVKSKGDWMSTVGALTFAFGITRVLNISMLSILFLKPALALIQIGLYETVFFLFVVTILMTIFVVFITITFAKEIAKVLGTEIDLSSLEKLL